MACKRRRRSYGAGCVTSVGEGLAIRWREGVIESDGTFKKVLRYKALGKVSLRKANEELQKRLAAAVEPKPKPLTFAELAASWKANVLPHYPKHSTRKHHADILDNKLIPYFCGKLVAEISGEHVQRFIHLMVEKGYAPHSVHHYHTVLSAVLTKAVEWKHISSNPAYGVRLPKIEPVREQHTLAYRQAQDLLELLPFRPKIAVALALGTGARRGELFALRWKHFAAQARTLSIEKAIYDDVIDSPKTKDSVRTVPLPQPIVQMLTTWKSRTKFGKPEDFIFAGRQGVPGDHKRMLRDYIKPACEDLGIPAATWLTFRRTWATWADGKGITPKMRGELMGNSAEVNQQVYTKVLPETLRYAVEVVGKELFSDCSVLQNTVN